MKNLITSTPPKMLQKKMGEKTQNINVNCSDVHLFAVLTPACRWRHRELLQSQSTHQQMSIYQYVLAENNRDYCFQGGALDLKLT